MKKFLLLFVLLLPFISGCKKEKDVNQDSQIKEIAWNSLTVQEKSSVIIDWESAKISQTTYNSESVYSVVFNTKDDALLGPIVVYVSKSSKQILGQALRM